MGILDEIFQDFFEELESSEKVPNDVIEDVRKLIEKEKFSSEELLKIINKCDLNGCKD